MELLDEIGDEQKKARKRVTSRRITNIHLGSELASYMIPAGTDEEELGKEKAELKPISEYHFESRGLSSRKTLQDKVLTWKADFDYRIDQFIYPSLQSLSGATSNNLTYEQKKAITQNLHGHYDHSVRDRNQRKDSSAIEISKLSGATGTGRENLVDKITNISSHTTFVRNSMALSSQQAIKIEAYNQPLSLDEFYEKPLSWKVELTKIPEDYSKKSDSKLSIKDRLENAEEFLRKKIKGSYHKSLVDKLHSTREARKQTILSPGSFAEEDVEGNIFRPKSREARGAMFDNKEKFSHTKFAPGDKLYSTLRADARARSERYKLIEQKDGVENVLLSEAEVFYDQRRSLSSIAPVNLSDDHLYDGILYYRMGNEFNKQREKFSIPDEIADEFVSPAQSAPRRYAKRTITKFCQHQERIAKMDDVNVTSLIQRGEHEDSVYQRKKTGVADLFQYEALDHRSQILRALHSTYIGYNKADVLGRIGTPLSSRPQEWQENGQSSVLQRREAQDRLLYNQLKLGIIPEKLFKKTLDRSTLQTLDLSFFGLGDEMGLCLGMSLTSYPSIESIGLRECRLTSKSLPTIIKGLSAKSLTQLDLSSNVMRRHGADALASFFMASPTSLIFLSLSHCDLRCSDVVLLGQGILAHTSHKASGSVNHKLTEIYLDNNKIKSEGAKILSVCLKAPACMLKILDLNWNFIGAAGAEYLADALSYMPSRASSGCPLNSLQLSCNSISDEGSQKLAASLKYNTELVKMNLSYNGVSTKTCFIFSSFLMHHPRMRLLDLNSNPLGEEGARCLFKIILRRVKCFVMMKNCTFALDPNAFDISNPAAGSPYELDTSDPYQEALLNALMSMSIDNSIHLSLDNVTVQESIASVKPDTKSYGSEISQKVGVVNGVVLNLNTLKPWSSPPNALVKIICSQKKEKPTVDSQLEPEALEIFCLLISNAATQLDRVNWLRLMCYDHYFTTSQIDYVISTCQNQHTQIGVLEIFANLWSKILDTENKFEFLNKHLNQEGRQMLVNEIGFEKYRFNWLNCSGNWHFDLGNKKHREIFLQLAALNSFESRFSKENSGRGDTSQKGNWSNYRNESYCGESDFVLDESFTSDLPYSGSLLFDYVSSTRPTVSSAEAAEGVSVDTISKEEIKRLCSMLGLSKRKKLPKNKCIMAFLDIQVASCKYYFTVQDVLYFFDHFEDDDQTKVKLIIILFSRILDIENMHVLLREVSQSSVDIIARSLGWLNILNPLVPYHSFNLLLRYRDNRLVAYMLLSLGSQEQGGDNVREDSKRTEMPLTDAYANLTRMLTDPNPKRIVFSYKDLVDKSPSPVWNLRKDLIKNCLVGTQPINKTTIYRVMNMYKELELEGALTRGPIDLQYRDYLKSEKYLRKMKSSTPTQSNRIRATSSDMSAAVEAVSGL